jgi:hypothetical protein
MSRLVKSGPVYNWFWLYQIGPDNDRLFFDTARIVLNSDIYIFFFTVTLSFYSIPFTVFNTIPTSC